MKIKLYNHHKPFGAYGDTAEQKTHSFDEIPKNPLASFMSFTNCMFLQNLKLTFSHLEQLFIIHFVPKLSDNFSFGTL